MYSQILSNTWGPLLMTADIIAGGSLRTGDNQLAIIDPQVDAATGNPIAGLSNCSDRQSIMVQGNSNWQIARTGAHEIGHGMGLHEANTLNYNLMQQSHLNPKGHPYMGTMINAGQLDRMNRLMTVYNAGKDHGAIKSQIIP